MCIRDRYIPSKNIAYKGPATLKKKSDIQYENMRPGFFLDALAVRGLEADDFYSVKMCIRDSTYTEWFRCWISPSRPSRIPSLNT